MEFLTLRNRYKSIPDAVEYLESELILLDPLEFYDKAQKFTVFINEILGCFHIYCKGLGDHEQSEEEVKNMVQTIFVKIKNSYPLNES